MSSQVVFGPDRAESFVQQPLSARPALVPETLLKYQPVITRSGSGISRLARRFPSGSRVAGG